ncbi:unnamed protein product [Leptidea sinapis]|uniref:Uncharacterized protein n=1 Tax=Leptidea sinapis TaxID=189913 RepID=A0A5E4QKY2_9NEOP|nr:unnamed protein product [Leptidea sinapis]
MFVLNFIDVIDIIEIHYVGSTNKERTSTWRSKDGARDERRDDRDRYPPRDREGFRSDREREGFRSDRERDGFRGDRDRFPPRRMAHGATTVTGPGVTTVTVRAAMTVTARAPDVTTAIDVRRHHDEKKNGSVCYDCARFCGFCVTNLGILIYFGYLNIKGEFEVLSSIFISI